MLSGLKFPFSIIGLTETKMKVDGNPIANVNIPKYQFVNESSLSNAGGVAFYIKTIHIVL